MFKALKKMAGSCERYMTYRGRVLAREHLLRYDNRLLADNGFSRELLEKGVTSWPWRTETMQDALAAPSNKILASQEQAMTSLNTHNDAQPGDTGITHGSIEQVDVSGSHGTPSDHHLKVA